MKSKLLMVTFFSVLITLVSCKKDSPDDTVDPDETDHIELLSEIFTNISVYSTSGSSLFHKMNDGSYSIGYTDENLRPHLCNYSSDGNSNWNRIIGGDDFEVTALDLSPDGGYIVSMYSFSRIQSKIIKLDDHGDSLWSFGTQRYSTSSSIEHLSNGNICYASVINKRGHILMISNSGDSLGSFYVTDTLQRFPQAFDLIELPDGTLISVFNFSDNNNVDFACLSRSEQNGALLWQKNFTGYSFTDINVIPENGFLCVSPGDYTHILRLNSSGDIILNFSSNRTSTAGSAVLTENGDFLLCAFYVVEMFNSGGQESWSQWYYQELTQSNIQCCDLIINPDNTYTVFGYRVGTSSDEPVILTFRIN